MNISSRIDLEEVCICLYIEKDSLYLRCAYVFYSDFFEIFRKKVDFLGNCVIMLLVKRRETDVKALFGLL